MEALALSRPFPLSPIQQFSPPPPPAISSIHLSIMIDIANQNQFSFANPRVEDCPAKDVVESGSEDDHRIVTLIRRASLDYSHYKRGKDDFSTSSNLLWKNKGFPMSSSAGSTPMHYSSLRAQEIARYRQEMMDLVRGMPESAYELSLRDMVETPARLAKKVDEAAQRRQDKGTDKSKGPRRLPRNETMNGLFLKTFVPVLGGGKMKRSRSRSNSSAKVSPKPEAEKVAHETTEGAWWRTTNESGDQDSSSSKSSSQTSNRSTSRSSSRKMGGCYAFFFTKKSKKSKETSKEFVE